jgi:BirA family biotin operon repressor/biotin-[acetyl-CoA-carboxylase] ligase
MIKNVIHFDVIDSTNKYIKEHLTEIKPGTLIDASKQTNGYGRKNRTWFDSENNLTFSFLLKELIHENTHLYSQVIAVAILQALNQYNLNPMIKWPNDIMINHKKIAGILIESKIINDEIFIIIGIGLNVNQTTFDSTISSKATSMKNETGMEYNKNEVLKMLIEHINKQLTLFKNKDHSFLTICQKHNYLLNKEVYVEEINTTCKVIGIDHQGKLKMECDGLIQSYFGSEVSLKNIYKQE